jgi:transcriptional regulator with XRE-family HTH domain
MSIGSNIKAKRSKLGISQAVFAEKLHLSQATLSNIEADKSVPDVILLQQIADALDTNINDLLDGKTVFVNNNNQKGGVGYAEVVNQLSEKLIALYEQQLKEKDEIIKALKARKTD